MTGALSSNRKYLLDWRFVSRIGPMTPTSTTSENMHMGSNSSSNSNAFIIVVIALTVSALLCLAMFVLICRRAHTSNSSDSSDTATAAAAAAARFPATSEPVLVTATPKHGLIDETCDGGSKWSAASVELVVMAGQDVPTFLAHPALALTTTKAIVVECPPLQLMSRYSF